MSGEPSHDVREEAAAMQELILSATERCVREAGEEYLSFLLGNDFYGISILSVSEIRPWESATRVPNSPQSLAGILNLRGDIVPVLDLRRRFGLKADDLQDKTVVIVVLVEYGGRSRVVGMIVDGVSDVVQLTEEQIQPAPVSPDGADSAFVAGLAQVGQRVVMLLDLNLLLADLWEAPPPEEVMGVCG